MQGGGFIKYITTIESFYTSLSKAEKKVADFFLNVNGDVIYNTLLEVSKETGVGEATVVRFCRRIGFTGFQDLKLAIAREYTEEVKNDNENFADTVAENMTRSITNTRLILNKDTLDKAVDAISKSHRLFFYGVGASGIAAGEAQSRFLRFGKIGNAVTDAHFQLMYSAVCTVGDVIVAISLSGYTKDILESVRLAKDNGAFIIVLTNHTLSPLASLANCLLLTAGKESLLDGGSFSAKIAQLYMLDLLCTGYAIKEREAGQYQQKSAKAVIGMINS